METDKRWLDFRAEVAKIRAALMDALPENCTYAALIAAFAECIDRFGYEWSRQSVKRWRKPITKERT